MGRSLKEVRVDPESLTDTQRAGSACVLCRKRWPLPRVPAGLLPDGTAVYACEDCAGPEDLQAATLDEAE